jgi:hypothetical protein
MKYLAKTIRGYKNLSSLLNKFRSCIWEKYLSWPLMMTEPF